MHRKPQSLTLSRSVFPIVHDLRNRDKPWYIRNTFVVASPWAERFRIYLQPLFRSNAPQKLPHSVKWCKITAITSFKVTNFGTNRKPIYDFLLATNTNVPPILHRFLDIAFDKSKIAILGYPSCV